jgi:hypothetical protein
LKLKNLSAVTADNMIVMILFGELENGSTLA